jgi:hypothetical protein
MIVHDRRDGRQLGARLHGLAAQRPVVVGSTREGVPVAAEVARARHPPISDQVVTDELAAARRAAGTSASARPVPNHVEDAEDPPVRLASNVRAQALADLRLVPLGNALFTRESFEAIYGSPVVVGAPEHIDLRGREPGWRCLYCDADRFTTETYATDRPEVNVEFWWCELCELGHAVSWGAADTVLGSKEGHHAHGRHAVVRSPLR